VPYSDAPSRIKIEVCFTAIGAFGINAFDASAFRLDRDVGKVRRIMTFVVSHDGLSRYNELNSRTGLTFNALLSAGVVSLKGPAGEMVVVVFMSQDGEFGAFSMFGITPRLWAHALEVRRVSEHRSIAPRWPPGGVPIL